jgi:hypothetical protein
VREKPEQKVYSLLGRLKSHADRNPEVFVAVGGCVAQQIGEEFWNRFPFVRLVFGTDGTAMVPDALDRLVEDPALRIKPARFSGPLSGAGAARWRQCSGPGIREHHAGMRQFLRLLHRAFHQRAAEVAQFQTPSWPSARPWCGAARAN